PGWKRRFSRLHREVEGDPQGSHEVHRLGAHETPPEPMVIRDPAERITIGLHRRLDARGDPGSVAVVAQPTLIAPDPPPRVRMDPDGVAVGLGILEDRAVTIHHP